MESLRSPRANLGAKQMRMVTESLPRFIQAPVIADEMGKCEAFLGPLEAKALGRLLTTLKTKTTVVGVRGAAGDSLHPKAESLARPFARHAPAVLLSYLSMMASPISFLSLEVRNELEPGIFALCDMMGEHGRDAIMASSMGQVLDSSGKQVLKNVWKEYEKQRYTGAG